MKRKFPIKPNKCLSTHGAAGYLLGSYWDNGAIVCPACGTRIINPRATGRRDGVPSYPDFIKVDSAKRLKACPIHEIRVGYRFYDELLESVNSLKLPNKVKSPELYLASLYGVKIVIDPELKKNEYRIVQPDPYEKLDNL